MYTKGKWEVITERKHKTHSIEIRQADDNSPITWCYGTDKEAQANAERICLCVNSHDDLLEALNQSQTQIHILTENLIAIARQCELAGEDTITGTSGLRVPVSDIAKLARQDIKCLHCFGANHICQYCGVMEWQAKGEPCKTK